MKRVVFPLSFFILLTLSTAFRVTKLDLSHPIKLSDHDRRIKPSSPDGSDSSTIESYPVPDHTESQKTETITSEDLDHLKQRMKWVPVQSRSGLNHYYFLTNRFKPHKCRHQHRLIRHPIRFVGENEVGFATVQEKDDEVVDFPIESKVLRHRHVARDFPEIEGDEPRMDDQFVRHHYMIPHYRLRHRHHHHHHHHRSDPNVEEDAQGVEVKEAVNEDEIKEQHKDDEHEDRENYILKKIGKFLGHF